MYVPYIPGDAGSKNVPSGDHGEPHTCLGGPASCRDPGYTCIPSSGVLSKSASPSVRELDSAEGEEALPRLGISRSRSISLSRRESLREAETDGCDGACA